MSKKVNRPIYVPLEKAKEIGAYIKEPNGTITPVLVGSLDNKSIPIEGGLQIPIENFPVITINEPKLPKPKALPKSLPKSKPKVKPKILEKPKTEIKLTTLPIQLHPNWGLTEEVTLTDIDGTVKTYGPNDELPFPYVRSVNGSVCKLGGAYGDLYASNREYHDPADNAANWGLFGTLVAPQFMASNLGLDLLEGLIPAAEKYGKRYLPKLATLLGLASLGLDVYGLDNSQNTQLESFKYNQNKLSNIATKDNKEIGISEQDYNKLMQDALYNFNDTILRDRYDLLADTTKFSKYTTPSLGKIAEVLSDEEKVYNTKTGLLEDKPSEPGFSDRPWWLYGYEVPWELLGYGAYKLRKNGVPNWMKNIPEWIKKLSPTRWSKTGKAIGLGAYAGIRLAGLLDLIFGSNHVMRDSGLEKDIVNAIEKMLEERKFSEEQRKRAAEVIEKINDANMGVSTRRDSIINDSSGILNTSQLTNLYQDSAGTSQLGMRPEQ